MSITPTSAKHYSQLQPEDRVTLASLRQQNYSIRAIARQLQRAPSTISRELSRNPSIEGYGSAKAQQQRLHRRRQARPAIKLHVHSVLFAVVHQLMLKRWSPQQIALALARSYPEGSPQGMIHRVSHETIYNCIYGQRLRIASSLGTGRGT